VTPFNKGMKMALARVQLIEAGPQLLASFPERLRRRAERRLKRMGFELFLNRAVAAVQGHELQLGD
jgi:NADH:ubiquinone reductase (H+-translocating)